MVFYPFRHNPTRHSTRARIALADHPVPSRFPLALGNPARHGRGLPGPLLVDRSLRAVPALLGRMERRTGTHRPRRGRSLAVAGRAGQAPRRAPHPLAAPRGPRPGPTERGMGFPAAQRDQLGVCRHLRRDVSRSAFPRIRRSAQTPAFLARPFANRIAVRFGEPALRLPDLVPRLDPPHRRRLRRGGGPIAAPPALVAGLAGGTGRHFHRRLRFLRGAGARGLGRLALLARARTGRGPPADGLADTAGRSGHHAGRPRPPATPRRHGPHGGPERGRVRARPAQAPGLAVARATLDRPVVMESALPPGLAVPASWGGRAPGFGGPHHHLPGRLGLAQSAGHGIFPRGRSRRSGHALF